MKRVLLFSLVTILGVFQSATLAAEQNWGRAGRDGQPGRSGRVGESATNAVIRIDSFPQTIDLLGSAGEDGEDGLHGEDAYNCRQPLDVAYNLRGARGGDGGSGGSGGDGGSGGNATIYAPTLSTLQYLVLNQAGGQGGRGGRGGQGGRGCVASQRSWWVSYCRWGLYRRPIASPEAPWEQRRTQTEPCTGDRDYDEHHARPPLTRSNRDFEHTWKYEGIARRSVFRAVSGKSGEAGAAGADGQAGRLGEVLVVVGDAIPSERVQERRSFANTQGQSITLVRNFWDQKSGLLSLLGAGSKAADTYKQLRTVQTTVAIQWQTNASVASLGNPAFEAALNEQGQLDLDIPGTLDYSVDQKGQATTITVRDGIHPDRLGQVRFQWFNQSSNARNFVLKDEANLLPDLRECQIEVKISNGTETRTATYTLAPTTTTTDELKHEGQFYKFLLTNPEWDDLIQSGAVLNYVITIDQITKSGHRYRSGMTIEQVADRPTQNPPIEYFGPEEIKL